MRGRTVCPGVNANEIRVHHGKNHKVSSLVKSHQPTHNFVKYEVIGRYSNNPAKYEVLIKQYLRSIIDISEKLREQNYCHRNRSSHVTWREFSPPHGPA